MARPALADPALATGDVNMRAAPTTNAPVILLIPGGSNVEALGCNVGWCEVVFAGRRGYAIQPRLDFGGDPPPPPRRPLPPPPYARPAYPPPPPDYYPPPGYRYYPPPYPSPYGPPDDDDDDEILPPPGIDPRASNASAAAANHLPAVPIAVSPVPKSAAARIDALH
jgi:hypothetical protein